MTPATIGAVIAVTAAASGFSPVAFSANILNRRSKPEVHVRYLETSGSGDVLDEGPKLQLVLVQRWMQLRAAAITTTATMPAVVTSAATVASCK
jgi:hypothetical protein